MQIPSNKISDIVKYFHQKLSLIYDKEELDNVVFYAFEKVLGVTRTALVTKSRETVNESDLLKLNFICKRLLQHEPIQYVLGETEFFGLKFIVNPAVLIPRPETEELVDLILRETKAMGPISLLDIGTGSGCIALSLKKNKPQLNVFAIDVSEAALKTARLNAENLELSVQFMHGDILQQDKLNLFNAKLDVIVSNPPYIALKEATEMDKRVLDYEPHLALFVEDNDPLLFYKCIADFAKNNLHKKGRLYFELNALFAKETKLMLENIGFTDVSIIKDINNNERMLSAIYSG